jgi:NAD(P)-dependent dehydrogenase (short-subunit alcohol dehydrogenase family)
MNTDDRRGPSATTTSTGARDAARVAIVTGASRGIGRAIALGLADAGYRVVVTARTERDESAASPWPRHATGTIHETARHIAERGGSAEAVRCDVTEARDVESLVRKALDRFGRVDVLVANAGIDCEARVVDLDIGAFDRAFAVNVRAPLVLCRFALPAMIARGAGSIIGISSGAAGGYRPGRVAYSTTKAALERMLLSLAEEVRPHGIAVNALRPGRLDTWMNRRGDWPGTAHMPLEPPEAVVPAALWLAEQTADTFSGHVVDKADFGVAWGPRAGAGERSV